MKRRIYALDALKFFASICIIFHHYQGQFGIEYSVINFSGGRFNFSYLVELFFIISGYLTYASASKIPEAEQFGSFMKKRCIRLLPINAITAAAHCGAIQLIFGTFSVWGWAVTAFGLFALGGTFSSFNVNSPAWYVSVLLACYVWFYALTYWSKRKGIPAKWMYLLMAFAGLLVKSFHYSAPLFNDSFGRGYLAFFIGVLLMEYTQHHGISKKLQCFAWGIVIAFCGLFVFGMKYIADGFDRILTFFVYPAVVLLCDSNLLHRIFRFRWLRILGEVSFGMYLWHTPLFQLLGYFNATYRWALPLDSWKFMVVTGIGVIAFSLCSLYWLEKPIARKLTQAVAKSAVSPK